MDLRLLASLTALALLAGCASPDPAPVADDDRGALATDGMAQTVPLDEVEPADPVPVTVACEITRTNLGTTTGYGFNIDRALVGIDECPLEALFGGNTTWAQAALVEATWVTQPSQTGTDLWIESDLCPYSLPTDPCEVPHEMGSSSPLALTLTADELRSLEGHGALVMVAGQGLVVDLVYTLYVTLFPGPIESGFSAVP